MPRPLNDWPGAALLHVHKALAYLLFFLGALLGIATTIPHVLELKGEAPDNLAMLAIIGGLLLVATLCIAGISRISREVEARLAGAMRA